MSAIKRCVIALESRLSKPATIEDIIKALDDEKMGIEAPEKEWQRIRMSPPDKLMESVAMKAQNKKSE
jgi:ActR/RegA family two-component response regulator